MAYDLNQVFDGIFTASSGPAYKIMLRGEDGCYCIADKVMGEKNAIQMAERLQKNYGEGQHVYIERY